METYYEPVIFIVSVIYYKLLADHNISTKNLKRNELIMIYTTLYMHVLTLWALLLVQE